MATNPLQKTAELADEERRQVLAHQQQISDIVLKVEELLIGANCTWQEWHDIVSIFNERNERVIPKITIKEIKQRYNEQPK